MEAAAPKPNRKLAESEERWMRPVGVVSLVGVLLIVISTLLRQSAGKVDGVTEAAKLRQYADLGSSAIAGDAVALVGLALLIIPLYFLFQAAAARAPRVRRGFVIFIILGPLLLGVQGLVGTIARESAGNQYVSEYPTATPDENRKAPESGGGGDSKTTGSTTGSTASSASTTTGTGTSGTSTNSGSESKPAESPREKRANEIIDNSKAIQLAAVTGLVGALGFVFALVYTSLWAFRVGLLTRFWGTLGMALGVALIFLGSLGFLGLLVWFAVLGLMFVGIFPGGRPPAWASGMAIPWPKPEPRGGANPPAQGKGGSVEGSGRELDEPALPEGSPQEGEGSSDEKSPPNGGGESSGKSS